MAFFFSPGLKKDQNSPNTFSPPAWITALNLAVKYGQAVFLHFKPPLPPLYNFSYRVKKTWQIFEPGLKAAAAHSSLGHRQ